jgi:phenacrylate decarboxylase
MPLPKFVNESEYVGALTGNSTEVIKCEPDDVVVSARSEVVFGWTISVTETAIEGPM